MSVALEAKNEGPKAATDVPQQLAGSRTDRVPCRPALLHIMQQNRRATALCVNWCAATAQPTVTLIAAPHTLRTVVGCEGKYPPTCITTLHW